ncbi:serine/threonine protein kinase [bacterium]
MVNGKPVIEHDLANGDIIEIGYTQIQVIIHEDIVEKNILCEKCGREIVYIGELDHTAICSDCLVESQVKVEPPSAETVQCICDKCGEDLTEQGNSDGRGAELNDKVTYLCPKCLPASEFMVGEKIGSYELIKFLAEGGMGDVYLVYHRDTARYLVLKQIKGLSGNELMVKHFEREIRVHSCLNHPNIIQYIDSGIHQNKPFYIIEYANHGDLNRRFFESGGVLPIETVLQYMTRICEGLVYLHHLEEPVVHRDLKPENILLKIVNDETIPKITDFGIAKPYAKASGSSLTKVGDKKGTILFMSPEQILSCKDVDHRCDIYAMGVILYYMLTAKLPYTFPSPIEQHQLQQKYANNRMKYVEAIKKKGFYNNVIDLILDGNIIPITKVNPQIPAPLAKIVETALARDINERYQNTNELLEDIHKINI